MYKRQTVTLEQIKQIPGVTGIVPALHYLPAGEVWPLEDVTAMRDEIAAAGFTMECIESVNVHEDIKIGLPSRDKYIDNYIAVSYTHLDVYKRQERTLCSVYLYVIF